MDRRLLQRIDNEMLSQNAPTYYVFSSPPQPVWVRPKYRNNIGRPRGIHDYYNMMWDPHVRRGDPLRRQKEERKMRKCLKKEGKRSDVKVSRSTRPTTPPPVEGRENFSIQTENYWESLDLDVTACDARTQTIALHELPVNPWFTPTKLGQDSGTQIFPGDLFNFEAEIQPVVETLVGKVVEQSLLECMEEEELLTLQDQQMIFEERRRLEQLRLDRLKQREQQVFEEKERLMKEMEEKRIDESEAECRLNAAVFASLYLTNMSGSAVRTLRSDGFLNSAQIISSLFIPQLNAQVEELIKKENIARALLDDMINLMVLKREGDYELGLREERFIPPPTTPAGDAGESEYLEEGAP